MSNSHSLEQVLLSLSAPPAALTALPTTHLTRAEWFEIIIQQGQLSPLDDRHFNEKVLYFFYGGVFYRPPSRFTSDQLHFPVAFVFDPSVLSSFARYYPFDTGAMFNGFFGDWSNKMAPFQEAFKICGTDYTAPTRMVYHLFGSNEEYLRGNPRSDLRTQPAPLPLLLDFFKENLKNEHTDHRQYTIECQANCPIPLDKYLIWVGYPDYYTDQYLALLEKLKPYIPRSWRYEPTEKFNPRDIAAQLETRARADIIDHYVNLPQRRSRR